MGAYYFLITQETLSLYRFIGINLDVVGNAKFLRTLITTPQVVKKYLSKFSNFRISINMTELDVFSGQKKLLMIKLSNYRHTVTEDTHF